LAQVASHPVLDRIDESLLGLDRKPQFAWPPHFPKKAMEEVLQKLFSHPELELTIRQRGWVKPEEIHHGMGQKVHVLAFECSPLVAPAFFLLNQEDLKGLMQELLGGEKVAAPFYNSDVVTGFTHYLCLEILQFIEGLKCFSPFSPKLAPLPENQSQLLKEHPHFLVDVSIKTDKRVIWGRLVISELFRDEWNKEASQFPKAPFSEEQLNQLSVDVACVAGTSDITKHEWERVEVGDLLLLDKCHFFPEEQRGNITLYAGKNQIFRGKLKDGELKILEIPNFEEKGAPMDEEFEDEPPIEEEDEFELPSDETEEEGDEELDEQDEFTEDEEIPSDEEQQAEEETPSARPKHATFTHTESANFDELPVSLHVELGRIKMTLMELTELSAGNVLQLPEEASQGVDLVVNGKRVGRGEIVKIGEALGVRILAL
jgi:flagellar motor switch protein FliN